MNKIAEQFDPTIAISNQLIYQKSVNKTKSTSDISFEEILNAKKNEQLFSDSSIKFSKHANARLASRDINLTMDQARRLEGGVAKASAKGINDSLVLVDSLAFIVNVPNRTVVTAMDQTEADTNVFTNIDGAVIM